MSHRQDASQVSIWVAILAIAFALLLPPSVAVASECTSAKYKAVGAAARKKAKCHARAVRKGEAVNAECLANAEAKLSSRWRRAEAIGDCLSTADEANLAMIVGTFVSQATSALEPPPSTAGCCALSGGICLAAPPDTAQLCVGAGGTPGAPGEVCDAGTGTCQPPPSSLGPCCEAGECFAGPGVAGAGCAELLGSFFPSATCLLNQTCGVP